MGETMGDLVEIQSDFTQRSRYPRHAGPRGSTARCPPRLQRGGHVTECAYDLAIRGLTRGRESGFRHRYPFDRRGAGLALLDRIERTGAAQGEAGIAMRKR